MTRTKTSVHRPDLHTSVYRLAYDFATRTGTLFMPPDCCTDMSGALKLFKRIDPDVECIETMAGDYRDTVYRLQGGTWEAKVPRYQAVKG